MCFSKVAEVHECALCEEREVGVRHPDIEPAASVIHEARVLTESVAAKQTCTGVNNEFLELALLKVKL